MDEVFRLAAVLSFKDMISGGLAKVRGDLGAVKKAFGETSVQVTKFEGAMRRGKIATGMLAAGTATGLLTKGMVQASLEAGQLESNLASLGLKKNEIEAISISGNKISTGIGIAKESYLAAAYDIKSAISSMSAKDLNRYGRTVAETAIATKGDIKDMAKLFGMTHNTYKEMYSGMADKDLGRLIGNSISWAVQKFTTDGRKMAYAMQTLGANAASMKIPFAESMAVLGELQNTMQGGVAGSSYTAFLRSVGTAQSKLNMNFTDTKGKLLPIHEILGKLRKRFGETIEVKEKDIIQKAFGSDEAYKFIAALIGKTSSLKKNTSDLQKMNDGMNFKSLTKMVAANTDNYATSLNKVQFGLKNIKSSLGKEITNQLNPVTESFGNLIETFQSFLDKNPGAKKAFAWTAVALTGILLVGGAVMGLTAMVSMYSLAQAAAGVQVGGFTALLRMMGIAQTWTAVKTGVITAATYAWSAAQWVLNAAFLSGPWGWVIAGVTALIAVVTLAVYKWDWLTAKFSKLYDYLRGVFSSWYNSAMSFVSSVTWGDIGRVLLGLLLLPFGVIPTAIVAFWPMIKNFITKNLPNLYESGKMLIQTLGKGISASWGWLKNSVKKGLSGIRSFFHGSEPKDGPLRGLARSGEILVRTHAEGIEREAGRNRVINNYLNRSISDRQELPGGARSGGDINITIGSLVEKIENSRMGETAKTLIKEVFSELLDEMLDQAGVTA